MVNPSFRAAPARGQDPRRYFSSPEYAQEQESLRRRVEMIQQQKDYQIEARMLAAKQGLENLRSGKIQTISPLGNAFKYPHGPAAGTGSEDRIRDLLSQQCGGGGMSR